jgi:hypothetical protein
MSSKETPEAEDRVNEEVMVEAGESDSEDNSLAKKLSKELNNWRRQRSFARPHRSGNGGASNSQPSSEPARTIRVRGHETLVIRKPKLVPKGPANPDPDNSR